MRRNQPRSSSLPLLEICTNMMIYPKGYFWLKWRFKSTLAHFSAKKSINSKLQYRSSPFPPRGAFELLKIGSSYSRPKPKRLHLIVNCPFQKKNESVSVFGPTVGFFTLLYDLKMYHTGCVWQLKAEKLINHENRIMFLNSRKCASRPHTAATISALGHT